MNTNRIEKQILLKAPRERVWHAISDSGQFGRWFGIAFDGPFVEGVRVTGKMVPTSVDAEVAAQQKPYEGMACDFFVERLEPMRRFSFRWHPYPLEPDADASTAPMTLIVFDLEEAPGGVLLRISESGFDQIPLEHRAKAFADNEGGWEIQTRLIEKYLAMQSQE
jgi:uncharacterized protein YndB with AHSA1/START domain